MNSIIDFINNSLNIATINLSESDTESSSESSSEEMRVPNFESFIEGTSFSEYIERFEAVMLLHEVEENDKTMHLIGGCGAFLYSKMCSATNPRKPIDVPFEELVQLLKTALCPKNIEFVERAKFYSRSQKAGENAVEFSLQLRTIAKTCNFGEQLETHLRDRFVMGLRDEKTKTLIIQSNPKSLEAALGLAQTNEISQEVASSSMTQLHQVQRQDQTRGDGGEVNRFSHRGRQRNYQGQNRRYNYNQNFSQDRMCQSCDKPLRLHRGECPAKNWTCRECGRVGHVWKRCPNKRVRTGQFDQGFDHGPGEYNFLKYINVVTEPPVYLYVNVNGVNLKCEIDSGATTGVITRALYEKHFFRSKLSKITNKVFTLANDSKCNVRGVIEVILNEKYKTQAIVVESEWESPPLVGRTWLDKLFPKWKDSFLNSVSLVKNASVASESIRIQAISRIKEKFATVFEPRKTPIAGFQAHLTLKSEARAVYRKPSVIPLSLVDKVKDNLNDLLGKSIIKRVDFSDWASQIVVADKKNGDIRVCCNYKRTLNPNLERHDYPIPRVDDILFTLNGLKFFTLIDLSGAYLQLELDEESQPLTTINTHIGLFSFRRLPFGVKTAPAIFQQVIDKILNGLVGVVSYFDDILVGGGSIKECEVRTISVLERLRKHNVQANFNKCVFFETKIEYLGHCISADGVSPSENKIKAIAEAPAPHDVTSLRSFLGLLNFYSKFLPNLQGNLRPLHDLLQANVKFEWTNACNDVFVKCKEAIIRSPILSFFDPMKPMTLVCDAGPYGVGAILNVIENGEERAIYMESASLSTAERNYSQLDRETLAIVFGVKKFHRFLYGHEFTVFTDCQALVSLLSNKKDQSTIVNSRFLRWILFLQNYDYTVKYRPKKYTANADALSRLPQAQATNIPEIGLDVIEIKAFNENSDQILNKKEIKEEITRNEACQELYLVINKGWPNKNDLSDSLKVFYNVRESLSLDHGCIFYGDRIFVPPKFRAKVLEMLHEAHFGVVKCKQLARQVVWWPKIDHDIEEYVGDCVACQVNARNRSYHVDVPWKPATKPFERVHLDHFFFGSKIFLLIVDEYSNWLDVKENANVSTKCVIKSVKEFVCTFGLPQTMVTDNATCFNSEEFQCFCKSNNIVHLNSPPYRPRSNGIAERCVGIVKEYLKKYLFENRSKKLSVEDQLMNFLFTYRTSPLTGKSSPASYLFKHSTNTNLSILSKQAPVEHFNQDVSWDLPQPKRTAFNSTQKKKTFEPGHTIYYYHTLKKIWTPGVIVNRLSFCLYKVRLEEGHELTAHISNIKRRVCSRNEVELEEEEEGMLLRSGRRK